MTTDETASPVAVVRRYLDEIYHQGTVETVREITADGRVRHDPGGTRTLDHEAQIARIRADLPQWRPWFTAEVLPGDDEYAVLVWTARGRTAEAAVDPSYPADEALEDYRTQVMSGLMITTGAIAVLPDVEGVNTLILPLLERNCAAVADWDAVAATRGRSQDARR